MKGDEPKFVLRLLKENLKDSQLIACRELN